MDALHGSPKAEATAPAFVSLSILPEPAGQSVSSPSKTAAAGDAGVLMIEIGSDGILRIPDDVAVERAVVLVQALRGAP